MKKITRIAAALLLVALILAPMQAFALTENTSVAGVRFVEPKDIFTAHYGTQAENSYLYVLDDIGNGTSVLHRFNVAATERKSYEIIGSYDNLFVIQSDANNAQVYLLNSKGIYHGVIAEETQTLELSTELKYEPTEYAPLAKGLAVYVRGNATYAVYVGQQNTTQKIIKADLVNKEMEKRGLGEGKQAIRLTYADNCLYVSEQTENTLYKYEITSAGSLSEPDDLETTIPDGTVNLISELWKDDANIKFGVSTIGENATVAIPCKAMASYILPADENFSLHYFVLEEDNIIYKWDVEVQGADKLGRDWQKDESFALGTDRIAHEQVQGEFKLNGTANDELTGEMVICLCGGYPSDFVYAYDSTRSVSEGVKLTDNEVIIWLKRNESIENADKYAYVFYNGKYGFVEKQQLLNGENEHKMSATAQTAIDTHLYALPYDGYKAGDNLSIDSIALPKNTKLTIVYSLDIWGGDWYYVTYDGGAGWVDKGAVDNIKEIKNTEFVKGVYRVNPSAGGVAEVFLDSEGQTPLVLNESAVTLDSGVRVSVLDDTKAYYRIQFDFNGQYYVGYIAKEQLIERGMSAGEIVGLSLLVVAVVIIAFLVIMSVRRKKYLAKKLLKSQEEQEENLPS